MKDTGLLVSSNIIAGPSILYCFMVSAIFSMIWVSSSSVSSSKLNN